MKCWNSFLAVRFEQNIYLELRRKNEFCYFNDRNFELREENQQNTRQSVDRVFSEHSTVEISGRDNAAERECFIRWKYDGNLRFV